MPNYPILHNLFTDTVEDELGSVLDDIPDAWRKERDHPGHACHLLEVSIPAMDAFNMLWKNFILGTVGLDLVRCIDDEHLVTALLGFALAKDQDAGSKAGAVEEIRAEIGRGFEQIHVQDLLSDLTLSGHAKEGAVWQHYSHPARGRGHGLDHVLDPGIITALGLRHPPGRGEC